MWSSSSFLPEDPAEGGRRTSPVRKQLHTLFWYDQTVGRDEGHVSYIKKLIKQVKQGQFMWKH